MAVPGILVVGPRDLPESGTVRVWVDVGSGGSGQKITVPFENLRRADRDDGQGRAAIYQLTTYPGRG